MKLRVAHCLETVSGGGVEQRRLLLAQQLDRQTYDQVIICTKAGKALPAKLEAAGCNIHEVGVFSSPFDWRRYGAAREILRDFRPHIVHGAVFGGVMVAAVSGRAARVPVIIGEETSDPTNRSWRGHVFYRALCAAAHHMVAVSPEVGRYLIEGIRVPRSKVSVINNGVREVQASSPELRAELQARFGINRSDCLIGTVGRLFDGHKRVSDLIRALPLVRGKFPTAKLLVVGDGPDRESLAALANELQVSHAVIFVGYQSDTRPFFDLMDVFALASAREAFGLVLVEAMFAQLPVVATRVGGIPDVVEEGKTGLLVAPHRPDELATAIISLLDAPDRRRRMGEAGQLRARQHFSAERYVRDVDALYQRLARERGLI